MKAFSKRRLPACGTLMTLAPVFGVLAGVGGRRGHVPYVRDILRGKTRPHRGTWFIWGVLAIVVCVSQRADGGSWSLVMAGTQAVLTRLHLRARDPQGRGRPERGRRDPDRDRRRRHGGWVLVDEPIVATACVIAADLIAAAMMVPKVYRDPARRRS